MQIRRKIRGMSKGVVNKGVNCLFSCRYLSAQKEKVKVFSVHLEVIIGLSIDTNLFVWSSTPLSVNFRDSP